MPIGVERGWCSRAEARDLTLTTLRFFWNAPQGPERAGTTGYKGFFYHFLDMQTGLRFRDAELSSVDTAILLMGVLFAGQYFDRDDAGEREIRDSPTSSTRAPTGTTSARMAARRSRWAGTPRTA